MNLSIVRRWVLQSGLALYAYNYYTPMAYYDPNYMLIIRIIRI